MKNQLVTSQQWFPQNITALEEDNKVNLVLSGGGVKGVAHIALIEKLEKIGLTINAISGSSAGALVGALYASGMRSPEILAFFKSTPLFRYTWLNPTKAGIFNSDKYELVIKKYLPSSFGELKIPLYVTATNLEKCKVTYFNSGDLIRPLLASCAVPAVFSPVNINGELHTDGGVMDNFPILPFLQGKQPIIGSYVCRPKRKKKKELNGILKVSNHSNGLLLYAANEHKFYQTHHTVVFPIGQYDGFDTKRIDDIYLKAKAYLNQD